MQTRCDPGACLVDVDERGVTQQVRDHIAELAEPAASLDTIWAMVPTGRAVASGGASAYA